LIITKKNYHPFWILTAILGGFIHPVTESHWMNKAKPRIAVILISILFSF